MKHVILFTALCGIAACGSRATRADRTLILECPSPSADVKALFWSENNSGAWGSLEYVVSISAASSSVDEVLSQRVPQGQVLRMSYGPNVRLIWADESRLSIQYAGTAQVSFKSDEGVREMRAGRLRVEYETSQSLANGVLPGGGSCVVAKTPFSRGG